MRKKELSIIIPVYNVQKYLRQCLQSVVEQLKDSMEIICVNDGSTDKSLEIINEFAKDNSNIKIIDKINSGYGDSLNKGIDMAIGKYIAILESDDWAVEGIYSELLSRAIETDADIVKGNYYNYYTDKEETVYFENLKGFPYDKVINSKSHHNIFFTGPAIWSGIYKKKFLLANDIRFVPTAGASYQDTSFSFKTWATARTVVLINKPIIYYRQDSINSSSNNSKKVFDIFYETDEMTRFLKINKLEEFMPECMVAKFRSMKWSLDRLKGQDKLRFLLKMHIDAQEDCIAGYLKEELWSAYDWMIINNIIFNVDNFANKLLLNKESTCSIENVIEIARLIESVYIFNTDYYAAKLYGEMVENGYYPNGYLYDGNVVGNRNSIIPELAIPIQDFGDKDALIIVNKNDKDLDRIINLLNDKKMNNYLLVNVRKVW